MSQLCSRTLQSGTSSRIVTEDFLADSNTNQDILVRFQLEDGRKAITVTSTNTQIIRDGLNAYHGQHEQDINLLRSVIFWLRNNLNYDGVYTAFLLGCLSEEEFEEESEKFTVYEEFVDPIKIAQDIQKMYSLIGVDFDTSDYAGYFKCSQENVMEGLKLLKNNPIFMEKLPQKIIQEIGL